MGSIKQNDLMSVICLRNMGCVFPWCFRVGLDAIKTSRKSCNGTNRPWNSCYNDQILKQTVTPDTSQSRREASASDKWRQHKAQGMLMFQVLYPSRQRCHAVWFIVKQRIKKCCERLLSWHCLQSLSKGLMSCCHTDCFTVWPNYYKLPCLSWEINQMLFDTRLFCSLPLIELSKKRLW